jgi:hypothetical protein
MDEFQASPPHEIERLRNVSAQMFGDLLLTEAVGMLARNAGDGALEQLKTSVASNLKEVPDHSGADDRPVRLAIEELERAIQLARTGHSDLRGWTLGAEPSIQERRT